MLCIMDNSDVSDKVLRTQSVKITKKSFCVSISNAYAFRLTVSGNKILITVKPSNWCEIKLNQNY